METICDLHFTSGALGLTIALGATMTNMPGIVKSYVFHNQLFLNRYVRQFIERLHKSGIRLIVVFDGGHDKSDQKLATVISRMTEQSRNAVACTPVSQVRRNLSLEIPIKCNCRVSSKFFLCLAEKFSRKSWKSLMWR